MIKIEKTDVYGWEAAIRGMRNPMNSWEKTDSIICYGADGFEDCTHSITGTCPRHGDFQEDIFCMGKADHELMMKLAAAGSDHAKFRRMIVVYADVMAPLYWWKEYDTYKVGTTANSCSTMHKLTAKEFTIEDFSFEDCDRWTKDVVCSCVINALNMNRLKYLETKDKELWRQMVQLLPSSYNQRRTVMLNYEVLANIYRARKDHKLDEWHTFCDWIRELPYSEIITVGVDEL